MWIIDETFPADSGTRFLKIDAHDDAEVVFVSISERLEAFSVLDRSARVVDGAWANDNEDAVVFAEEYVLSFLTSFGYRVSRFFSDRKVVGQHRR